MLVEVVVKLAVGAVVPEVAQEHTNPLEVPA